MILTCNATGEPQPEITWSKSEGSLPESRTVRHDAQLTILNVTLNDSGLYVCTAVNSVGSNSSFTDLSVVRASEPTEGPRTTQRFETTQGGLNTQGSQSTQEPQTNQRQQTTRMSQTTKGLHSTQGPQTTTRIQTTQGLASSQWPQTTQMSQTTKGFQSTPGKQTTNGAQTTQSPQTTQVSQATQVLQPVTNSSSLLLYVGQDKAIQCPVPTDSLSVLTWMYNDSLALPDGVTTGNPKVLNITSAKMNLGGNYTCVVRNPVSQTEATAHVIINVRYPETCSRVRANISDVSGWHVIDPDGPQGTAPFHVYCNMTDKGGVGVTVVSHDTENRTHVKDCLSIECYSRDVIYTGASFSQLDVLTEASTYCEQFISFECYDSKLNAFRKGWWVSRSGQRMDYWGGATNRKGWCGCAVTDTCDKSNVKCNCDVNDRVWREDSGLLIDKSSLPVSQLRFEDLGADHEEGYHTLGKFKCYGMT